MKIKYLGGYCIVAIATLVLGCDTSTPKTKAKTVAKAKTIANFEGTWVSHDFIIDLKAGKSPRRLGFNNYCTELVFQKNKKDSVWMINEDLERATLPYKLISPDSIEITKFNQDDKTFIYYDKGNKMLAFLDKSNNHTYTFEKADTLKYGVKADKYISCFRKMMNEATLVGTYRLYKGNSVSDQKVTFNIDGTISGWDAFETYYLYVNGDMASMSDDSTIGLGKKDKKEDFGWVIKNTDLYIYKLKLKKGLAKTDKPDYEFDKVAYRLYKN